MKITIQQLIPDPLKEYIQPNSSDIWKQELSFRKGEHIFIQAPSGTGKTTLMHILYGIRKDYQGTVYWDEDRLSDYTPAQLAYLRASYISIIFQDLRLFPELTVWENLELKRTLTHTIPVEKADDMLFRLGMAGKQHHSVATLSRGEKQRVSIIRALLQPFDWLLMDEPFSHLDEQNREKAAALITEVAEINQAGILLADLEKNRYFYYHKTLFL